MCYALPCFHFPGRPKCAHYFRSSPRCCSRLAATIRIPTARRVRPTAIPIRRRAQPVEPTRARTAPREELRRGRTPALEPQPARVPLATRGQAPPRISRPPRHRPRILRGIASDVDDHRVRGPRTGMVRGPCCDPDGVAPSARGRASTTKDPRGRCPAGLRVYSIRRCGESLNCSTTCDQAHQHDHDRDHEKQVD